MNVARDIRLTSELPADWRPQLEDLLFFNENQSEYRDVVVASIERFGEPRVVQDGGRLRLQTSRLGPVQALFAVETHGDGPRLVAAALFSRTTADALTLIHIAVHADYASAGPRASAMVTVRLIGEVTRTAARIKGVDRVDLLYGVGPTGTTEIRPPRLRDRPRRNG